LQFPRVLSDLGSESVVDILLLSGAVLLVVLVVRPLYIYPTSAWANFQDRRRLARMDRGIASGAFDERRKQSKRWREYSADELRSQIVRERMAGLQLSWKDNAVISWAGMRGVVTLAIAVAAADLATLDTEASHAIVVVAFIVTVGTLLLQGLTLPLLIRRLGIAGDAEREEDEAALESVKAKSRAAGKEFIAQKRVEWEATHGAADLRVFDAFTKRMNRVEKDTDEAQEVEDAASRPSFDDLVALSKGWLQVRREILVAERDAGNLDEEVMRELLTAMDAEELAMDTRGATRPSGRA
jgi:CPA1 family monovalent cation:H+ antiporter